MFIGFLDRFCATQFHILCADYYGDQLRPLPERVIDSWLMSQELMKILKCAHRKKDLGGLASLVSILTSEQILFVSTVPMASPLIGDRTSEGGLSSRRRYVQVPHQS